MKSNFSQGMTDEDLKLAQEVDKLFPYYSWFYGGKLGHVVTTEDIDKRWAAAKIVEDEIEDKVSRLSDPLRVEYQRSLLLTESVTKQIAYINKELPNLKVQKEAGKLITIFGLLAILFLALAIFDLVSYSVFYVYIIIYTVSVTLFFSNALRSIRDLERERASLGNRFEESGVPEVYLDNLCKLEASFNTKTSCNPISYLLECESQNAIKTVIYKRLTGELNNFEADDD